MNRSSVVDSFFSAFLGFWVVMVVSSGDKPIMEDWTVLLLLPFIATTMWLLSRANSAGSIKDRCNHFVHALSASLLTAIVFQIVVDGEMGVLLFATQPRTWFLCSIVSAWFILGGILVRRKVRA